MTLMLVVFWIAGFQFHWWWLLISLAVDIVWLLIKLNFTAVLVRRSAEEVLMEMAQSIAENVEPPEPPQAGA